METKSNKGIKGILTLTAIFALCVTLVLATTFGLLTDTKTATGTITFDLANYDFQVKAGTATTEQIYPGQTAQMTPVNLKNTYKTRTDGTTGATAGMDGVYVRLTFTEITIGMKEYDVASISENSTDGTIVIVATNDSGSSSDLMTIALNPSAGTSGSSDGTAQYWRADTDNKAVYLSSTSIGTTLTKTKLAFTDISETETTKKIVVVDLQVTGKESDATQGFNASSADSAGLLNSYQGNDVKVGFTVAWGTTPETIGGSTTTNA